jgi:hypothetical protein
VVGDWEALVTWPQLQQANLSGKALREHFYLPPLERQQTDGPLKGNDAHQHEYRRNYTAVGELHAWQDDRAEHHGDGLVEDAYVGARPLA